MQWKNLADKLSMWAAKAKPLAPTLTRLTIGWVFIHSGWGKFHNLDGVIAFFRELQIPFPELQAPFVAGVEFVCGLMVLLGVLTRLAALPLIGVMVVAILTARMSDLSGVDDLFGFIEYLYICMLVYLVVDGPGPLSIDKHLR